VGTAAAVDDEAHRGGPLAVIALRLSRHPHSASEARIHGPVIVWIGIGLARRSCRGRFASGRYRAPLAVGAAGGRRLGLSLAFVRRRLLRIGLGMTLLISTTGAATRSVVVSISNWRSSTSGACITTLAAPRRQHGRATDRNCRGTFWQSHPGTNGNLLGASRQDTLGNSRTDSVISSGKV
jgi:hypothetical protein